MGKPLRVLLVEDSEDDALLLVRHLRDGGLEPAYERVDTADAMSAALDAKTWDAIICDYGLPGFSVLGALDLMTDRGLDLPFIVVSGTIGEEKAADLMRAGAHDLVLKDNLSRLIPAIERELAEAENRQELKQAEEALQLTQFVVDHAGDAAFWLDPDGHLVYANDTTCDLLGYSRAQLLALSIADIDPDVRPGDYDRALKRSRAQGPTRFEARYHTKADAIIPVEVTVYHLKYGDKELMACYSRDITERKRAEEALRESEARLRSIASNVPGAIFRRVHKPDGTIHYPFLSGAYKELFGHDPERLTADASVLQEFAHPEDFERLQAAIKRSAESLESQDVEYRIITPEGRTKWVRAVAQARRRENGDIVSDGIVLDVTDRKEAEQRVEYLAYHDGLTDLPNRALFTDRLHQAVTLVEREDQTLAVLCLGLDGFTTINDTLGHAAGDAVLKEVGARLGRCVRAGDTVARMGGDVFLILLTRLRHGDDVTIVLRKVLTGLAPSITLKPPATAEDHEIHVTASIGVSVFPGDGKDPETLLRNADNALHRAKTEGPGASAFFTADMNRKALARLSLETQLRRGLEKEEFVVHYQPQVDLREGKVVGVEALVRWQPPDSDLVSPGEFIALAEQTGLIVPLGEWVLRAACAQARAWREAGIPAVDIAVNAASHQLRNGRFAATVERVLSETGVSPDQLKLELTESSLMEDAEGTARLMATFREMGVRLAVDDFGTGYSSLSYLSRFPIETLKVDRSFVVAMTTDPSNAAIVNGIVSLAHSLDMTVVAEGVDADDQLAYLRAYRCDAIQGYIFSPPVPAQEIPCMIEQGFPSPTAAV